MLPTIDGRPKLCTTWSSPSPTTRWLAISKPTPTSRWVTRPRVRNGGESFPQPHESCAKGVIPAAFATASEDSILAKPIDILFDFAAAHFIGDKGATVDLRIDFSFTDLEETWTMWIQRRRCSMLAKVHRPTLTSPSQARKSCPRRRRHATRRRCAVAEGEQIAVDGNRAVLETYANLLDSFDPNFAIVTPD